MEYERGSSKVGYIRTRKRRGSLFLFSFGRPLSMRGKVASSLRSVIESRVAALQHSEDVTHIFTAASVISPLRAPSLARGKQGQRSPSVLSSSLSSFQCRAYRMRGRTTASDLIREEQFYDHCIVHSQSVSATFTTIHYVLSDCRICNLFIPLFPSLEWETMRKATRKRKNKACSLP